MSKKAVSLHKLNGTYRKDRYGKQEQIEKAVADIIAFSADSVLEPPKNITDNFVKQYYQYHTNELIKLRLLTPSDIPELNNMYLLLQQLRKVQDRLDKLNIDTDLDEYERLTKLEIKLSNTFSELAKRYFISPTARTKLQLDKLDVEKKQAENQSVISKLINKSI